MLKRMVLLILLAVLLCSTRIYAATPKQEVVFSFDFNKRFKLATNQFAVWIENDKGELVKTLFVTAFTAGKGWEKRRAREACRCCKRRNSQIGKTRICVGAR